jgi:hypothetical protein
MREDLSIAEEIERDRRCREAHYEAQLHHDEALAIRDRADEKAPLPAWHPWRAELESAPAEHPATAERRPAA